MLQGQVAVVWRGLEKNSQLQNTPSQLGHFSTCLWLTQSRTQPANRPLLLAIHHPLLPSQQLTEPDIHYKTPYPRPHSLVVSLLWCPQGHGTGQLEEVTKFHATLACPLYSLGCTFSDIIWWAASASFMVLPLFGQRSGEVEEGPFQPFPVLYYQPG